MKRRSVIALVALCLLLALPGAAFADCWCDWTPWYWFPPYGYCCDGCTGGRHEVSTCFYYCNGELEQAWDVYRCAPPAPVWFTCC
jgi:hypothetical protein